MLFHSWPFLLLFLPLLLYVCWSVAGYCSANLGLTLLAFSLLACGLWGVNSLFLLLLGIAVNYTLAMSLGDEDEDGPFLLVFSRRGLLALAIALNLLPLLWFRYSAFLLEIPETAAPPGLAIFALIQIAWLVGIYRHQISPGGIGRYALFSSCFCYALAGPIVRHEQVKAQFDHLTGPTPTGLAHGFTLLALGLGKKVILADNLAPLAQAAFSAADSGLPLHMADAWLGSLAWSFRLYFDFSGYTDMAIGIGLMLGLRLPENFNSPYKATGFVDFWRRWHITLSQWLRDFIYIPLGGRQKSLPVQCALLLLCMLVCGLWHGAGWTFVAFGAMHGAGLAINHCFRMRSKGTALATLMGTLPLRLCCTALTFFCVNLAWLPIGAADIPSALRFGEAMFQLPEATAGAGPWPGLIFGGWLPLALLAVCALIIWGVPNSRELMEGDQAGPRPWLRWQASRPWAAGTAALALAALLLLAFGPMPLAFGF